MEAYAIEPIEVLAMTGPHFDLNQYMLEIGWTGSNIGPNDNRSAYRCQRKWSLSHFGILLSAALFFSSSVFAESSCKPTSERTEICSIRITFSGQPRTYQYEIKRPEPGNPIVIEIPGGPGQGYVGKMNAAISGGVIPQNFGVIAIDPRGVGRNDYGPDDKGDNYTSDLEVSDILNVIKQENLKDYFIHGQSYGTLVATKLGSMISNNKAIEPPKGIVLSGILPSAMDDQLSGYNVQIHRMIAGFDASEKVRIQFQLNQLLNGAFKNNQAGFSAALMQGLLFNVEDSQSIFGASTPDFSKFLKMLAAENFDPNNSVYKLMLEFAKKNANKTNSLLKPARTNSMPEEIKCTEMSKLGEEASVRFDIESFKLVLLASDCEQKGYKLTNPYDSKKYQISNIPIYYFQGDIDPATPASGAKKHYGSQQNTEKVYVEIQGYAHTNLLGLAKCQAGLWESMYQSPDKAIELINKCFNPNLKILGHQKTQDVNVGDAVVSSPGVR